MSATSRINIGIIRKAQIVEAASAVISEEGIQKLSLSAIENRAGMARGQLTYYFPTKEDILLAVFDRVLERMHERVGKHVEQGGVCQGCPETGWEMVRFIMTMVLTQLPGGPEFGCLQYTFLAQMGHRDDFRQRLATLYEHWRSGLAHGLAEDQLRGRLSRRVSPRAIASLVNALLHGLIIQMLTDPGAFDRQEMLDLCFDMLGTYLGVERKPPRRRKRDGGRKAIPRANGHSRRPARVPGAKR